MAFSFAGGTDRVQYATYNTIGTQGCWSLWFKTTQATANVGIFNSAEQTSSRNGFSLLLNNTANKVSAFFKLVNTSVLIASTTSVNDGNAHHVAVNWMNGLGNPCELYVDGVQEGTANHSQAFVQGTTGCNPEFGDHKDSFWASYVGVVDEFSDWTRKLTADEIAALAKGISPKLVAPDALGGYCRMIRNANSLTEWLAPTVTGTTISEQFRVLG